MKKISAAWPIVLFPIMFLGALALSACFQGCAGCRNEIASRGGLIGSYAGDYIVLSQSGGLIMDCWKLTDVYVESIDNSDGWRFKDGNGDINFIGGDVKVIRIHDRKNMDRYHEYHMEFETLTYRDKFGGLAEQHHEGSE